MACVIKKLPIKRKMTGWAKEANTSLGLASPVIAQRAGPSKAVTGMGMGSVIQ
jgi:hypothetical protein